MSNMPAQDLPYGKPFIFKLINKDLDYPLDPDNYHLSNPNLTFGDFNTTIQISPLLKTSLYGRHFFNYNRLVLDDLDNPITVTVEGETSLRQLLPKINAHDLFDVRQPSPLNFLDELNVPYIGDSEIIDKVLPPFGSANQTFLTMVARPDSYILTGIAEIRLIKP